MNRGSGFEMSVGCDMRRDRGSQRAEHLLDVKIMEGHHADRGFETGDRGQRHRDP